MCRAPLRPICNRMTSVGRGAAFALQDAAGQTAEHNSELRRRDDARRLRAGARRRSRLPPLLRRIGLTARDIENESVPLRVTSQIKCLNLMAEALGDRLLGFHVAQGMDLRRGGLLYYVAASSEVLGDALHRIARYSSMVNEGVKLEAETGEKLRIVFAYAGVPRRHDRHQIEAWTTLIIRYCRELTGRGLQALAVRLMHHRIPESGEIDSFCGRRIEFSSDMDEVSFAGEAAKLPIANADPFLNKLLIGYSENVVTRRSERSGVIRADVENALASLLPHGQTQIKNVARRLGVGPRTLRRSPPKASPTPASWKNCALRWRGTIFRSGIFPSRASRGSLATPKSAHSLTPFAAGPAARPVPIARGSDRRHRRVITNGRPRRCFGTPKQIFDPGSQVFAGRLYYLTVS